MIPERLQNKLDEHKCVLIDEYVNTMTKVRIKCNCGTIFTKTPNDAFKKGCVLLCDKCKFPNRYKFQNEIAGIKHAVIKDKYGKTTYLYNCNNCSRSIKRTITTIGKVKDWQICDKCAKAKMVSPLKKTVQQVSQAIASQNGVLISDNYQNAHQTLRVQCHCGAMFNRSWNTMSVYDNYQCKSCNLKSTKFETDVLDFVKDLNVDYISNDRKVLNGLELDCYIPKHNLAIECNGIYWHSEKMGKDKNYHLNKTLACESHGIQLIHIFDYLWRLKSDIYKSIIKNKVGQSHKVFARKCLLKKPSIAEERAFLDKHHLKGYTPSKSRYGLYFDNELILIATFGSPRYNKKYQHELLRVATKCGYTVVGGVSKIFSKLQYPRIISYADRAISNGNMYRQVGFEFVKASAPCYYYFKTYNVWHRSKFQKGNLKAVLPKFDCNKTEWENMLNNGYNRFYDCGNLVFEFIRK